MTDRPVFHQNAVLFGHDATPRLLAFEPVADAQVRVFARAADRGTTTHVREFRPWLLLASTDLLAGWGGGYDVEPLEGEGLYRFLVLFHSWGDALKARAHVQKATGKAQTAPDAPFLFLTDPVQQYLMRTGQTHFLELAFAELRRMQLDIETYCTAGYEFPSAARPDDRITAIALCDSTGWEHLISGKALSEPEMLQELVRIVRERTGRHRGPQPLSLRPGISRRAPGAARCHRARPGGAAARHASRIRSRRAIATGSTRSSPYHRHLILAALRRHRARAGRVRLKEIARHFAAADRTYIPSEKASTYFDTDPDTLFRYALDDVREVRALSAILSQSYFVQAQIVPLSYQNVALRGNATKIDALLMREYLRQGRAIPAPEPPRDVLGGHTEIAFQGVARRVLHCDVTSL
jgi:hypothetical protein